MNRKYALHMFRWIVLLAAVPFALSAFSPDTISVGIEPTATPVSTDYVSEAYGFTFDFPATWLLTEEPNVVKLSRDGLTLRIGYRWAGELVDISGGRTGMPAGDLISGGKVFFMDQVVPAGVLEYERQDKMILYGDNGRLEAGDLQLNAWLEDRGDTPYDELDISKDIRAEAKSILETFELRGASTSPPTPAPTAQPIAEDARATYASDEYGFAFDYPADWSLAEEPSYKIADPGPYEPGDGAWSADRVELSYNDLKIHIQFQPMVKPESRSGRNIGWTGGHSGFYGDAVRNEMAFLGAEASRTTWIYEGGIKAINIEYARPDTDLVLLIELFDRRSQASPLEAADELPEYAIQALDQIASSFTRTQ